MRKMKSAALSSLFFLIVTSGIEASRPPISMSSSARFLMSSFSRPANVVLVVTIEKHGGNKNIVVSCDSVDSEFYRRSDEPLSGKEERSRFDFSFILSPAKYYCQAVLIRVVDYKEKEFASSPIELSIF